jgi:hypothetical protein
LDEAGNLKNSDIAKELSLPPVKLHCSSEEKNFSKYSVKKKLFSARRRRYKSRIERLQKEAFVGDSKRVKTCNISGEILLYSLWFLQFAIHLCLFCKTTEDLYASRRDDLCGNEKYVREIIFKDKNSKRHQPPWHRVAPLFRNAEYRPCDIIIVEW